MPTTTTQPTRIAFVCVQNAGRSQMSLAFAERERERRGLDVELLTGGTHPADAVHDEVIAAMADTGIDLSDRTPRGITTEALRSCDYVATMGCSTLDLPADVDVRDWALDDPDGQPPERVHEIRDEIERRVCALFDEIEADGDADA
jgi:protein-tyrosine-phosphatase